ncbi:hypothetical protein [Rhizobium sp. BK176]|uniref:hypothetical protein n=1 Tax=Rhizobium sp. BK176 TaxID=2587071 RepID=UPI0021673B78|nr:hypothetical protein [Rhizobium sp. BK176]MCS4089664.1 hypothetical protein [Rhizobium sp. BK176]
MMRFGNISLALIIGIIPVISGCTTTSSDSKKASVSIKTGNFEQTGDAKIGNDIKNILAQGGLDANNPANTPVAAKSDDTPKVLSSTATDLQTLVAQLEAGNAAAATAPKPTSVPSAAPQPVKTQALALAEQPKLTKAETQTQIVTTTQTTTFEPIGKPGELVPIMPAPEIAQVPDVKAKPAQRPASKTRRVVTEAADNSSYKQPTVKRF